MVPGRVVIFTLGNSSDAFLLFRARERGLDSGAVLLMVASFNLIYASFPGPAGALSDKIGRRRLIVFGWLVYGVIYLGFGGCQRCLAVVGALRAVMASITGWKRHGEGAGGRPGAGEKRGTAYGVYNAAVGLGGIPGFSDRGGAVAGHRRLDGFWARAAPFFFGRGWQLSPRWMLWRILASEARVA